MSVENSPTPDALTYDFDSYTDGYEAALEGRPVVELPHERYNELGRRAVYDAYTDAHALSHRLDPDSSTPEGVEVIRKINPHSLVDLSDPTEKARVEAVLHAQYEEATRRGGPPDWLANNPEPAGV